jgi:NAD(P)-dependent dehydrogenase (short-subunit alcohol dehydrogenase family)
MPGQRLHNRVAIVTGSSQGIGREICNQFFVEGARIVCADLTPTGQGEQLETHKWIAQRGGEAVFVKMDVSVAADWRALVAKTVEIYGRLDMYVLALVAVRYPAVST